MPPHRPRYRTALGLAINSLQAHTMKTPRPHDTTPKSIERLRCQARQDVEAGAVTADYAADRRAVLRLLDQALAMQIVCMLRYRQHHFMQRGPLGKSLAAQLLCHSITEQGHADLLATRIVELGGEPDFAPDGLGARSPTEYAVGTNLQQMIRQDLIAERVAIGSYREMLLFLGERDPTTSRLLGSFLAEAEARAGELAGLMEALPVVPWTPHAACPD